MTKNMTQTLMIRFFVCIFLLFNFWNTVIHYTLVHAVTRLEAKQLRDEEKIHLVVDSLDSLTLLGDLGWLSNLLVMLFSTPQLLSHNYMEGMGIPFYDNELLYLAEDLARRILPAFDTPTGIPFGSVNLMHGVDKHESKITSTAGDGTLTLEFGILSRLTGLDYYHFNSMFSVANMVSTTTISNFREVLT